MHTSYRTQPFYICPVLTTWFLPINSFQRNKLLRYVSYTTWEIKKKKKRLFVWCKENSKVREWLYPKAAFWVEVSGRNIRAFSEDMTFEQENKRQDRHHYRKISEMRATVRYQRKNKLGMLKEKETMWVEHNEKEKSYDE